MQFAALAFPAHPCSLAGIPFAAAMQKQKPVGVVPGIELFNAGDNLLQEAFVSCSMFRFGISPIGQQGKIQIAIGIRQKMHFEAAHHVIRVIKRRQQHWNGNKGSQICWNAVTQRESRQGRGVEKFCRGKVDNGDGKITGRENSEHRNDDDGPRRNI